MTGYPPIRIGRVALACGISEQNVRDAIDAGKYLVFDGGNAIAIDPSLSPALGASLGRTMLGTDHIWWAGNNALGQVVHRRP